MKTSSTTLDELDLIQEQTQSEYEPSEISEQFDGEANSPSLATKGFNWLSLLFHFLFTSILLAGVTYSPFNKTVSLAIAVAVALILDISIEFIV